MLVAPSDVVADRRVLLVVAAVIGAVQREVAQGGELALDSVQPGRVGRQEHQLYSIGGTPFPHLTTLMDRVVIQDQVQRLAGPASSQRLEERQELGPAFAVADPVVQLAAAQVQGAEHMPHTLGPVVGRPQPLGPPASEPAAAWPRLQIQRTELVDADHPSVGGWMVIEVEDPVHLLGELGIVAGLPFFGGLPRHPAGFQDIRRSVSRLMSAISLARNTSASFDRLHTENGQPRSRGQHRANWQIRSRIA